MRKTIEEVDEHKFGKMSGSERMALSDIAEDREQWGVLVVASLAESSLMMKTSTGLICCCVLCVSAETVCSYHSAGVTYGQPRLVQSCIDWLEKTLLPLQSAELLQNIRLLWAYVCP